MFRRYGWIDVVVLCLPKHAAWRQVNSSHLKYLNLVNFSFQFRHHFLNASLRRDILSSFPWRALRTFQYFHNRFNIAWNNFYCETAVAFW